MSDVGVSEYDMSVSEMRVNTMWTIWSGDMRVSDIISEKIQ